MPVGASNEHQSLPYRSSIIKLKTPSNYSTGQCARIKVSPLPTVHNCQCLLSNSVLSGTPEAIVVEGSASGSASVTQNSGNSVVSASARVNLITPPARIPVTEAALSNAIVSEPAAPAEIVSGPEGSISADAVSALLLQASI